MRVALVHNLPSGGAKRHTLEQIRELRRRGHHIAEFVPSTADTTFSSFEPEVSERRVFAAADRRTFSRRLPLVTPYLHAVEGLVALKHTAEVNERIAAAVDSGCFDLAFVKDCHVIMNPYVLRYLRTPSVFQCHHGLRHRVEAQWLVQPQTESFVGRLKSTYYAPARGVYARQFRHDETDNIRSATRVLTNSEFSRALIEEHYGVNAGIVYPGINTEEFYPARLPKLNYVLSVGSLIYSKGYRFLVAALSRIPASRRPPLFIAANSIDNVEEDAVRKLADRARVELHIETITADERLRQVYSQALAFVYAPIQEALGMAPLEALACGTPVVGVREGGMKETLVDGVTGWTVDRDEAAFGERVDALLADDQSRRTLGDCGVEYVRQNWTWQKAIDRLETHFEAVRAT